MGKKKHAGGRPTKITEQVTRKLEEGFRKDFTAEEACRYAGISTPTFYAAQKKYPAFLSRMQSAQDWPLILAKKTVVKSLTTNAGMAMSFLERRQRDRYATKTINQLEGKVATYQDIEQPKAKSPEEARRMAEQE